MKLEEYYRPRLSEAGYNLLAVFSRFEYSMKNGGFRRENYPDAAWRTFAERLPQNFFQKMQTSNQAQIYFTPPPQITSLQQPMMAWTGQGHQAFRTMRQAYFKALRQQ